MTFAAAGADPAVAATRVVITDQPATRVGTHVPAPPIARDFVGVSMDWCSVRTYTRGDGITVLGRLLRGLDPSRPDLRIGGDGTDAPCHGEQARGPTPNEALAVGRLARAIDARLILGINLESHSERLARSQSRLLLRALGRLARTSVQAIEIGNEPDRYPRYGNRLPRSELKPYIDRFLHDFAAWAAIARAAFHDPRLPVAGPSLGRYGMPWITGPDRRNFGRFIAGRGRPGLITFHSYPLLGSAKCPSRLCGSLPDLLLDRATAGLARRVAPYVGLAGRLPVRIDEMNSVTQGGRIGVSNTFGSALWAADALFEFAQAGVSGVNFHTFSAARYALFSKTGDGAWLVHPEYYGLLLFARAAPAASRLLRVSPARIGPNGVADVKVWATRGPDDHTRIAIINKSTSAETLVLGGAGVPAAASVRIARMSAAGAIYAGPGCPGSFAGTGLCATGGATFGGATFGQPTAGLLGGDVTSTGVLAPAAPGTCTVLTACVPQPPYAPPRTITIPVPAGSAALLTGATPPRRNR